MSVQDFASIRHCRFCDVMVSNMKWMKLLLAMTLVLWGQPNAEADKQRLVELNRAADEHLASYDLDKAEPLLEQAVDVATRLGGAQEAAAHAKLYDLYFEMHKRVGRSWCNIGLPHLLKALEFAKTAKDETAGLLAVKYAIALLKVTSSEFKPEVSSQFTEVLNKWISLYDALSPESALAYNAFIHFPDGSPEQRQALNSCELLSQMGKIPAEFAGLLADCGDAHQRAGASADAIRFAGLARQISLPAGPRLAYEFVLSLIVQAEGEFSLGRYKESLVTVDAAIEAAGRSLNRGHGLWERMLQTRVAALEKLRDRPAVSQAKRDLKEWVGMKQKRLAESRLQIPKLISFVMPAYSTAAFTSGFSGRTLALGQISTDGTVQVIAMFRPLPFGLTESAAKSVAVRKYRPYLLDGKPVAGITNFVVPFGPSN